MVARMEAEVDRVREEMRELLAREMFTQIAYKSELMGESTPTPEKPIRKNEKNDVYQKNNLNIPFYRESSAEKFNSLIKISLLIIN